MRKTRLRASPKYGGAGSFNIFYWCQNIPKNYSHPGMIAWDFL
jgi:hypothetical protein